jgi:hypothetical protein
MVAGGRPPGRGRREPSRNAALAASENGPLGTSSKVAMPKLHQTTPTANESVHSLWGLCNETHRCAYNDGVSTTSRALTVRLDAHDYERLEREATRLGMRPGTLARVLLRASLGAPERQPEDPPISLERLLDRLALLREGLPPADAAAVVAEGRAGLERRGEP